MKTFLLGSVLVIMLGASTLLLAHNKQKSMQIISITDMNESLLTRFFNGDSSNLILECTEGTSLPFKLSVKGEYLDLAIDNGPWQIKILKTCYIKLKGNTFYFSGDLKKWQEFNDFFTGMIGVEMHVDKDLPKAGINLELNHKM